MSDDERAAIVDSILQRPISDIDTTSDDVSEKLITLECGHTFTVETLDGHCSMSEYYEVDPMTGHYVTMKAPPIKFQTPPACPTCDCPITSPRYGRVTKRANLDILEQKVASNMSMRLERHGSSLEAITSGLEALESAARDIANGGNFASEDDFVAICEKRKASFGNPDEPLPFNMLRELRKHHGFSKKEEDGWMKIVKEINRVYELIVDVASARSAHVKAYEAAITTLFKLEMEAVALDPSKDDRKAQQEAALEAVNVKIGQPPRKADRKYHIEAFLLSIELRLMLAQIASARVEEFPLTSNEPDIELRFVPAQATSARVEEFPLASNEPDHLRRRKIWTTFVGFLYDSCIKDCAKAISLTRSCSAFRQETRVSMVNLRCNLEKLQFDALEQCRKIQISEWSGDPLPCTRESLDEFVSGQMDAAQEALLQARTRYLQNRLANSQKEVNEETLWFEENCTFRAEEIFYAYEDLQEYILDPDVFYQPVSLREKQDISTVFGFGMQRAYTIHLYRSRNLYRSQRMFPQLHERTYFRHH